MDLPSVDRKRRNTSPGQFSIELIFYCWFLFLFFFPPVYCGLHSFRFISDKMHNHSQRFIALLCPLQIYIAYGNQVIWCNWYLKNQFLFYSFIQNNFKRNKMLDVYYHLRQWFWSNVRFSFLFGFVNPNLKC